MFPLNTDRQARGCGRKSLFLPVLVWLTVCLSAHAAQLPLHTQRLTVGNEIWNLQVPSGMQLDSRPQIWTSRA